MPQLVLGVSEYKIKGKLGHPTTGVSNVDLEGFAVCLQKKLSGSLSQQWYFTKDGCIYSPVS